MLENIIFNEKAYFYNKTKDLSKTKIYNIFKNVSEDKVGNYVEKIIKKEKNIRGNKITYSLCIYKFKSKPTFIDDIEVLHELKYGYLLIVEFNDFLVINKKHIAGLKSLLNKNIEEISYNLLSRLFISDSTYFEKFSMNNMDISDKAIRKKNLEANNIKDSFSPMTASKYILHYMRIANYYERVSLSFNTSRINKLGQKVYMDEYLEWIVNVTNKINDFEEKDTYLDHFAIPLDFTKNIKSLVPKSIIFVLSQLFDDIQDDNLIKVYYKKNGRKRDLNINNIYDNLKSYFDIERFEDNSDTFIIQNEIDKTLSVKKYKKSLRIKSRKLSNIILKFREEEISLTKYINKNQNYIITFNKPDIVYYSKSLFKDNKLLGNIDYFLKIFKPYSELNNYGTEKGEINNESINFSEDSIFNFIENKLDNESDYLICDDLGDEWADYISIDKDNKIAFYHAKSGKDGLSASKFHDVVGQAQKNLGNIFAIDELERKKEKWDTFYSNSEIKRLRKGNIDNIIKDYQDTLSAPNIRPQVYLVVNFISKSSLEEKLNELKNGNSVPNQIIQILWLLSSLVVACQESNTEVYIICLP